MRPALPKSAQKIQMFRMDPELGFALREGHKEAVLGSPDSFGETAGNEFALAADFKPLTHVSIRHFHQSMSLDSISAMSSRS